jgi:nuclear GTP-binding protein
VILQVLDARDPASFRSSGVEDYIKSFPDKRLVLVLNKSDLVPAAVTKAWLAHLRRSHPAIAVSARTSESVTRRANDTSLLDVLKNYGRQGSDKGAVVVGVIGYPNVGKSSLINKLSASGRETCAVSPRPGHTKSVATVSIDKQVTVLDSPGVVFDSEENGILLRNCVDPASMPDPVSAQRKAGHFAGAPTNPFFCARLASLASRRSPPCARWCPGARPRRS